MNIYVKTVLPFVIFVTFLLWFVGIAAAQSENATEIAWQENVDQAVTLSKTTGKPLYIHFYGDNCPPCKLMDRDVFTAPAVVASVNQNFVAVKIHAGRQQELAGKFDIKAIPTDVVLLSSGQLLHRRQGGISTDRFLEYTTYLLNSAQTNRPAPVAPPTATVSAPQPGTLRDPFTKQVVVPPRTETAHAIASPSMPHLALTVPPPMPPLPTPHTAPNTDTTLNSVSNSALATITPPPAMLATPAPAVGQLAVPPTVTPQADTLTLSPAPTMEPTQTVQNNTLRQTEATPKTMVEVPLSLEGYCPVILGKEEKWVPGNPAFYSMFRGHVFRFSSVEAMQEFEQSPQKFAPVAMGEDIVLMVDRNKKVYGSRKFGVWYQGRVYLFSSQTSLDTFAQKPEYYAEIAVQYETAFRGVHGLF